MDGCLNEWVSYRLCSQLDSRQILWYNKLMVGQVYEERWMEAKWMNEQTKGMDVGGWMDRLINEWIWGDGLRSLSTRLDK